MNKDLLRKEMFHIFIVMNYQIPEERLLNLIDKYVAITYPNAVKVEMSPPTKDVSISSLIKDADDIENEDSDEDNILIHTMEGFGMSTTNINEDFLDSVMSMFGNKKMVKPVIEKWFNNKPVDIDLWEKSKEGRGNMTEQENVDKSSKIQNMIDDIGLLSTFKFFGGYNEFQKIYKDFKINKEDMIKFIKDTVEYLMDELNLEYVSLDAYDEAPIFISESPNFIRQIEFLEKEDAGTLVYKKTDDGDYWLKDETIPYEELDDEPLNDVFLFLLEIMERD